MACNINFTCRTCHNDVQEAVGTGQNRNQCRSCENKETIARRAQHLKGLEALTTKERLAKLEAWTYDYKPPVNINDIKF